MYNINNKNVSKKQLAGIDWSMVSGLGTLLVIGSIAFSSYIVWFVTDDKVARIILSPQLAYAAWTTITKFIKK